MRKSTYKNFCVLGTILLFTSFFVSSFSFVNAQTYFTPPFVVYKTISDVLPTNTLTITENVDSYDLACTTITGACVIGSPFSVFGDSITRTTRTLNVTYQILSVSTPTKCEIGIITSLRTLATGAVSVTATTTETTANFAHAGSATANPFGFGIRSNDTSNPCTMTLRVKQISNSAGQTLWSPAVNGYNNGTTVNVSTGSTTVEFPATTTISTENDQLWNFTLLLVIFFLTVLGTVTMLKPLYVRK